MKWIPDTIKNSWTPAWNKSTKRHQTHPIPVFARLFFKELVELQHLLPGDDVDLELGQHLVHEAQVVVDQAFPIPPHVVARAPEDEHCVVAGVEQLVATAQDALHARMRDHPQGSASAHIGTKSASAGCVVHADHALGTVDLLAPSSACQVTRASDQ